MKLAKTNTKEILSLNSVLNELEQLYKDLRCRSFWTIEWDDYEILGTFDRDTAEIFIEDVTRHLSNIHFQRILFNCDTLLQNCADPSQSTLEFNADIAKGLELLREWSDSEPGRRADFPVERVAHADLKRIGESAHNSQCPKCTPGTLAMRRNSHMQLVEYDACLYCGQRVLYTDVKEGVLSVATH